jgi:hypothetical protein
VLCSKNQVTIGALLVFFSRKLTDTESRYLTFDRKLLATYAAICHFHNFCESHAFKLWTNHTPLVTALSCVSVPILHLQQQDLAFISEFNVQILYLPGLKNIIVDFLSYPHTPGAVAAAAADPVGF